MEYRGAGARRRLASGGADEGHVEVQNVLDPQRSDDGRKSHDRELMLWTELMALLTHVAEAFARPEVVAQLRSIGVRNTDSALTLLAREYAKASQIALTTGSAPRPHEVMNRARDLGGRCDLQQDFFELAKGYRLLIQELALPADCNRYRWLEGRALVHVARADMLELRR